MMPGTPLVQAGYPEEAAEGTQEGVDCPLPCLQRARRNWARMDSKLGMSLRRNPGLSMAGSMF